VSTDAGEIVQFPDPLRHPVRMALADSIADSIAEAIATNHLKSGDRIVETALSERLGVSRVPIREAMKVLHAQGILTGGSHRGYRVAAFDTKVTQQILEVRLRLEALLLRDAIDNWRSGREDPAALQGPIEDMKRSARAGDVRASLLADLNFRRTFRTAAQNAIVGTLWDTIARHVLIVFNFERYRDKDLDAVSRQHEELRDWILDKIANPIPLESLQDALEDHMLMIERNRRRHRD
jgi:DNA-binding GntR family transcriptional regulator